MDFEQALETQRHRLLRIIAGLVVLLGFLSAAPISRNFSVWVCGFVGSVLARAELAARYLVIAQAYRMAARSGFKGDRDQIRASLNHAVKHDEADMSPSACRRRIKVLRAMLMDLPRQAHRLLRRVEKQCRRKGRKDRSAPRPDTTPSGSLHETRRAKTRIERPPRVLSACS